ncbi:MAG: CaiB/BaiF CoA transferase family protein [Syntrophobacteraceae bacterium]
MSGEDSLGSLRILDFTGVLGPYAAKLYTGVGADVIHLEPVGGDPLRKIGPFHKNIPGDDRGLQFLYYNAGKKSLALDIQKDKGKEIFLQSCKSADVLIESFAPGYLNKLGLGYDVLSAVNPKLVHTAITLFGSTGPYANYPGSDLTCSALSGFTYLAGLDNDKPVRAPDDQAYRTAEAHAAVASSIALFFAMKTGIGQFIDVSCMESIASAHENAAQTLDLEGVVRRGVGGPTAGGYMGTFRCNDGHVVIAAIMGSSKVMWDYFVKWMKEEGAEGWEVFNDDKWCSPVYRRDPKVYDTFKTTLENYTGKHTKAYVYEKGQFFNVPTTPVSNGKDLIENPQLNYNNFWVTMRHEKLDSEVTYPGPPYEFGELRWRLGDPAPSLGQHTAQILEELGYGKSAIDALGKEGIVYVG